MISTVARTAATIRALADRSDGLSTAELASTIGVEMSVASRILKTLMQEGFVHRRAEDDHYAVTLNFIGLALRHLNRSDLSEHCTPILKMLAEEIGELAQLALVEDEKMIYVAKAEGRQRIRLVSVLGTHAAPHASSAGKIWLASLPEEKALQLALDHGLTKYTERTITTIAHLREELVRVREDGFAVHQQELILGANAIAVPVGPLTSNLDGALVVAGPDFRFDSKTIRKWVPRMNEFAQQLRVITQNSSAISLAPVPVTSLKFPRVANRK